MYCNRNWLHTYFSLVLVYFQDMMFCGCILFPFVARCFFTYFRICQQYVTSLRGWNSSQDMQQAYFRIQLQKKPAYTIIIPTSALKKILNCCTQGLATLIKSCQGKEEETQNINQSWHNLFMHMLTCFACNQFIL